MLRCSSDNQFWLVFVEKATAVRHLRKDKMMTKQTDKQEVDWEALEKLTDYFAEQLGGKK